MGRLGLLPAWDGGVVSAGEVTVVDGVRSADVRAPAATPRVLGL